MLSRRRCNVFSALFIIYRIKITKSIQILPSIIINITRLILFYAKYNQLLNTPNYDRLPTFQ